MYDCFWQISLSDRLLNHLRGCVAAQAADNLPLYGVCCYVEEMVHRPPPMLASQFPEHTKPLSRMLVAAPRCYAFLTNFPFFSLHMKVHADIYLVCPSESSCLCCSECSSYCECAVLQVVSPVCAVLQHVLVSMAGCGRPGALPLVCILH